MAVDPSAPRDRGFTATARVMQYRHLLGPRPCEIGGLHLSRLCDVPEDDRQCWASTADDTLQRHQTRPVPISSYLLSHECEGVANLLIQKEDSGAVFDVAAKSEK